MKREVLTLVVSFLGFSIAIAQSVDDLQSMKAQKEAQLTGLEEQLKSLTNEVDVLKAEVADLTDKLTPYPRWNTGAHGNVGVNFSGFSNWLLKSQPNTTAVTIGFSGNAFANMDQQKYFWRNSGLLTLGWLKFDDRDSEDDDNGFNIAADALNVSSLLGYKLSEKLALSTLGDFRTSVLEGRFVNPGYLDLGVGATWTPIKNLVAVFHPLNYNFVFSRDDFDYQSSLGCKIVVDYQRNLTKGIAWKSNLAGFISYEGSDLSNWTWVNGLTTAVKGIGVGFDFGLRGNKQEALSAGKTDNPIQSYWILGLSYVL
jgi:hypothetical protein